MKKFLSLLLCVALVLGCLSGCGSTTTTTEPAASSSETTTTTPDVQETTETVADIGTGNVTKEKLVIAMNGDVSALDPMKCWQVAAYHIYWTVYERLIKYNTETGEYEPELAESWDVSEDGMVYTFNLRKGVKWHDGSDFVAEDVKYTIERGIEEGTGNYPGVDHVEVVDDHTVKVCMSSPDSVFMDKQWTGDCCVIKKDSGDQLAQNPLGTGPFKFVEWVSGDHITLEAFDGYWGEQSGTKEIVLQIIPEANSRLVALQAGDVDVAGIEAAAIDHVVGDENLELLTNTSISVNYLGFNCTNEYFSNPLVRQAFCYAIDREALVEVQLEGQGKVQKSFVAEGKMGFFDDFDYDYDYNPEKAKELMAEAGFADGFDIELTIRNNELAAQMIQDNLREIGVNVTINQMEAAAFNDYANSGQAQFYLQSRSGGSADSYLSMCESSAFGPGGNRMFYADEEFDELYKQSHLTIDLEARNEIYKQLQENLHDNVPLFPLFVGTILLGINKNVKGVAADCEGCHDYRTIYYGE